MTPQILARELKIPIAQRWKREHHSTVSTPLNNDKLFIWGKKLGLIPPELVVQQQWLTKKETSLYLTMVRLHVMRHAGISEMLVTLNTQEMVDVEPLRRRATSPDAMMANTHAHSIC